LRLSTIQSTENVENQPSREYQTHLQGLIISNIIRAEDPYSSNP